MKREMIIGRGSERGTDAESFTGKETDGVGGGRGNGVRMFELDAWHCCCCCESNEGRIEEEEEEEGSLMESPAEETREALKKKRNQLFHLFHKQLHLHNSNILLLYLSCFFFLFCSRVCISDQTTLTKKKKQILLKLHIFKTI